MAESGAGTRQGGTTGGEVGAARTAVAVRSDCRFLAGALDVRAVLGGAGLLLGISQLHPNAASSCSCVT